MEQVLQLGKGERITGDGELGVALLADLDEIGIAEVRSQPGGVAPPAHVHDRHAEAFYVFEGELTFRLEDGERKVGPGTWVFVPPEVVHTFAVTGDRPARFLDLHAPSCGFGDFVRGLHAATTEEELRTVRAAFDQQPAPEYGGADPGLVVVVRARGSSGVGSTEPPESGGAGFAGAGAGTGVGSTEPPESGGAGFAGAGAGTGESISDRPERRVTVLVDAEELIVSEFFYGPGERGATLHLHREHADGFLVLEGEIALGFRDGTFALPAESLVLLPRDVVHGFDNDGAASMRCFNLHAPASGFGDYLRGRNPGFDQHDPPADGGADPAAIVAVSLSG